MEKWIRISPDASDFGKVGTREFADKKLGVKMSGGMAKLKFSGGHDFFQYIALFSNLANLSESFLKVANWLIETHRGRTILGTDVKLTEEEKDRIVKHLESLVDMDVPRF